MCGRILVTSPGATIAEFFELLEVPDLSPRFNVAPSQEVGTVAQATEGRAFVPRRWGLIPSWAGEASIGDRMINARSESVAEKPAFRDAFARRRCLVPADGFYEWTGRTRGRAPHHFRRRDGQPLAIAGVWEAWTIPSGDGVVESFALLTTEANSTVRPIHGRMPVLLAPEHFSTWLDPENDDRAALQRLLVPCPAAWLEARPVSSHVNDPRNDDPRCLDAPAPESQPKLF